MGRREQQDMALLRRYRDGDHAARDEFVERMLPLVRRLASRYGRGSEPLDDLVQAGSVGLVKAIDRFDHERGLPFMRFAVPTILGEIKRHCRDTGWAAHVPRGMQERVMKVRSAIEELSGTLGRSPSAHELADHLGTGVEDVLETLDAATASTAVSLDAPMGGDDEEGATRADALGLEDASYGRVVDLASVVPALRVLPEREREIVRLRFVEDLTQTQIAERVGVSQMHVSRLLRRALERVRAVAESRVQGSGRHAA
ncbi:MAG: SigB/SigF/SigG family RNA polymerase sigma factor [Thermoleophilaceae bacterium]